MSRLVEIPCDACGKKFKNRASYCGHRKHCLHRSKEVDKFRSIPDLMLHQLYRVDNLTCEEIAEIFKVSASVVQRELRGRGMNKSQIELSADKAKRLSELWEDPEYKDRIIKINSENMRSRNKANWKKPEFREMMSELTSINMKETAIRLWGDPAFREDRVKDKIEYWKTPGAKDNQSKLCVGMLRDPNNGFGKRRGISQYYNGVLMKSSWEVDFAKEMDRMHFLWEYECKTFKLPNGHRYTPDFYINKIDIFIEIKPSYFVDDSVLYKINSLRKQKVKIYLMTELNRKKILTLLKIKQEGIK